MGSISIGLLAGGLAFAVSGWVLTRADRLTFGQGAVCVLAGLALILAGLARGLLAAALAAMGVPSADGVVLLLVLVGGLALLLHQALTLSRVSKRLRRLVTEQALKPEKTIHDDAS